jgi:hypothetical protein
LKTTHKGVNIWSDRLLTSGRTRCKHSPDYADGSSHDNSIGSPPNKIKEKLKEKTGWDWDKMVMLNPSRRLIEQQQNMALDAMKGRQNQQAYSNGFSMPNLNAAGRVMLGSAGLYVAYRAARMLISLIPGLWWTAPANVACP